MTANNDTDPVQDGLQALLDQFGEGWMVSGYVIGLHLQRMDGETVERVPWWYPQPGQPEPMTIGLIAYLAGRCQAGELIVDEDIGE